MKILIERSAEGRPFQRRVHCRVPLRPNTFFRSFPSTAGPLSQAVSDSADKLASGIVYRLEHFAEKEQRVRKDAGYETLPKKKVLGLIFAAHNQTAKVLQQSEQPLYFPSSPVAPKFSAILSGGLLPVPFVRCDHFNADFDQLLVERIRVISLITNQSHRQLTLHD